MIKSAQVNDSEWQLLLQRRITFGHQSVGSNILSGVRTLAKQAGVDLPIIESRAGTVNKGITHFMIGRNEDPQSKIADFASVIEQSAGQNTDIALMKLCYIDIKASTDGKKLAEDYISNLDKLSDKFPNITFVAVTVPLTTLQHGPKAWVKNLLGRAPAGYAENASRYEFNNVLRMRYEKEGRLFDLARIESEGTGNNQFQGKPIEVLNPQLTSDGGHLNDLGEKRVATSFLKFLAALPMRKK